MQKGVVDFTNKQLMKLTAKEIAQQLDGIVVGDEQVIITHPEKIEQATKGAITFLSNSKSSR